jgi:WD40 repeat protein
VVSGSNDKTVRVWDLETGLGERRLEGHTDEVTAVVVTPDGRRAVSGSEDKTVRVWDLERGRALACFSGEAVIQTVALTSHGHVIVAGDKAGNVYCLDYVEPKAMDSGQ